MMRASSSSSFSYNGSALPSLIVIVIMVAVMMTMTASKSSLPGVLSAAAFTTNTNSYDAPFRLASRTKAQQIRQWVADDGNNKRHGRTMVTKTNGWGPAGNMNGEGTTLYAAFGQREDSTTVAEGWGASLENRYVKKNGRMSFVIRYLSSSTNEGKETGSEKNNPNDETMEPQEEEEEEVVVQIDDSTAADIEVEKPSSTTTINDDSNSNSNSISSRKRIREKVRDLAKNMVVRPIATAAPVPQAIAAVIKDATVGAVDMAVEEMKSGAPHLRRRIAHIVHHAQNVEDTALMEGETEKALDAIALAKTTAADAFASAEYAIDEAEKALRKAKEALESAKADAKSAIAAAERAAADAAASAQVATALATTAATVSSGGVMPPPAAAAASSATTSEDGRMQNVTAPSGTTATMGPSTAFDVSTLDVSTLTYEDVDYHLSEMAPPFIGEDQCLVPGEAVVRVEKAPENSRRIFAGIDILAGVDDVWKLLTDYENLQNVVPNLVINEVLDLYDPVDSTEPIDPSLPDEVQCEILSKQMKGAKLRQVGGAKVVGINFSARTTLEVREWPQGMPDFAHYGDEVYEGKSRTSRAKDERGLKLCRYRFPRPFAISSLPTRDISMQSVENDDGEFRMYQGVWRMQPLPGCAPEGQEAMRLTYAVEISPRAYLPVQLVERRISQDLCTNLKAIRDFVAEKVPA